MANLNTGDMKVFLPSKDFEISRRFYKEIGFKETWTSPDVCHFRIGDHGFLLQKFYSKEMADNFMMSLLVENLDDWWKVLEAKDLPKAYPGVRIKAPADYPWGLREIHLIDPSGVLWHIAQDPKA